MILRLRKPPLRYRHRSKVSSLGNQKKNKLQKRVWYVLAKHCMAVTFCYIVSWYVLGFLLWFEWYYAHYRAYFNGLLWIFCLFFNSNYRLILDTEGLLNVSQACSFTPAWADIICVAITQVCFGPCLPVVLHIHCTFNFQNNIVLLWTHEFDFTWGFMQRCCICMADVLTWPGAREQGDIAPLSPRNRE